MTGLDSLIVGIGSSHGDDQVGWRVVDLLRELLPTGSAHLRSANSPMQLLDWLDGVNNLILCDACCGLSTVGEIKRWQWPAAELAHTTWAGSHDFSLCMVLKLAFHLNRLPKRVVIFGVEGRPNDSFTELSPEVINSLPVLARMIIGEARFPYAIGGANA